MFLGYSAQHKGYKCLDISSGRVYISRDVVFDEGVFPFANLHPNAGALLRREILLLPSHLLGDVNCTNPNTTDEPSSDDSQENCEEITEDSVQNQGDRVVIPEAIAPMAAANPGAGSRADSVGESGAGSCSDPLDASHEAGASPASTRREEAGPRLHHISSRQVLLRDLLHRTADQMWLPKILQEILHRLFHYVPRLGCKVV